MTIKNGKENIPRKMLPIFDSIVALIDEACDDHLTTEYKDLCHRATAVLCRKRPSPLERGGHDIWACGIVYAIGQVNFLFDKTQTPHLTPHYLCDYFGVKKSTGSNKASLVMDILGTGQMDPDWFRPSRLGDNSLAWMVELDGFHVDARSLSLELQEEAFEKGLIPYIPSQRKERDDGPVFGSDNEIEVSFETMDPSEIPPLNEHAQAILDAMKMTGKPLSRRQILKETGIPSTEWSNAQALLMMHDLIETGHCNKRGMVFSCKVSEIISTEQFIEE